MSQESSKSSPISHTVFKFYFASHIPPTLILDSTVLLPKSMLPSFCLSISKYYCDTFKDPLFISPPLWFKSLIFCEMTMQLPFFFAAVYAFQTRKNWIRIPAICYAAHTATTLIPILANHLLSPDVPNDKRMPLFMMFLPYLLIPLWLLAHMIQNPEPFGSKDGTKRL